MAFAAVPIFTFGFAEDEAMLGLREPSGPSAAFSLAGTGQVGALLSGAGFGGIECEKADEPMLVGRDVDDVLEYERASPAATQMLAGLSPAQATELTRQVRDRLVAYASPDGVTMPGAGCGPRCHARQGNQPFGIAITSNGKTVYVTGGTNSVTPILTATNTAGPAITVGIGPAAIAIT